MEAIMHIQALDEACVNQHPQKAAITMRNQSAFKYIERHTDNPSRKQDQQYCSPQEKTKKKTSIESHQSPQIRLMIYQI